MEFSYDKLIKTKHDTIIKGLTVTVPGKTLVQRSDITIVKGTKNALIGINGIGKTTVMNALEIICDDAYLLSQFSEDLDSEISVIDAVIKSDKETTIVRSKLEQLNEKEELTDEDLEQLDLLENQLRFKNGKHIAYKILHGLGFEDRINASCKTLSGGWLQRLSLAKALFVEPTMLLLDEPCNHLDLEGIQWLSDYLCDYTKALIVVSHDIGFLEPFATHYLCMNDKNITKFNTLEKALEYLCIDDQVDDIQFPESKYMTHSMAAIRINDVSFKYCTVDPYILKNIDIYIDRSTKIIITGSNGSGKSTLLKMMMGSLSPTSGEIHVDQKLRLLYLDQHMISKIDTNISSIEFLKHNTSNNDHTTIHKSLSVCGLTKETRLKPLSSLSGGEKTRVLMALICIHDAHVILLDEPTNHLDIASTISVTNAIKHFPGGVVVVTHNQYVINQLLSEGNVEHLVL